MTIDGLNSCWFWFSFLVIKHAIAYTGESQEVYGARATINVWDPSIEVVNEFSLSQIWILSGSFDGADLNSIEAGWQVPSLSFSLSLNLVKASILGQLSLV